jgi:small GTP-binding protein
LLGDEGVGKTNLVSRDKNGFHLEDLNYMIGVDFYTKDQVIDGQHITLKIWNITREERFRFLLSRYSAGANGAFILYDITNQNSLDHIPEWVEILKKEIGTIPIILLGMKLDLEQVRSVSREKALEIVKSEGINDYVECSTKTGENIGKAFEMLTRLMLQQSYSFNYQ